MSAGNVQSLLSRGQARSLPPLRTGLLSFGWYLFPFSYTRPQRTSVSPFICCTISAALAFKTATIARCVTRRLLVNALAESNRAAIAQLVTRGKEQLVLIRPYENGLIMHSLYYANEVRNFGDIAKAENAKLSGEEIELGADLIENMSDEFNPDKYRDDFPYL